MNPGSFKSNERFRNISGGVAPAHSHANAPDCLAASLHVFGVSYRFKSE